MRWLFMSMDDSAGLQTARIGWVHMIGTGPIKDQQHDWIRVRSTEAAVPGSGCARVDGITLTTSCLMRVPVVIEVEGSKDELDKADVSGSIGSLQRARDHPETDGII